MKKTPNKSAGMRTLRLAHWFMNNMNSQLSMFSNGHIMLRKVKNFNENL